jgi:hypothetical protein
MNQNTCTSPESTTLPIEWSARHNPVSTATLVVLLGFMLMVSPAEAAIYKCLDSDGGTSYSSTACTISNQTERVLADNGINDIERHDQDHSKQKSNSPHSLNQQRSEASEEEKKRRAQRLKHTLMY